MLPLEVRKYLFDIWEACELLQRFTEGRTLREYKTDPYLRSAVERQFEIIGEALRQMLTVHSDLASFISDSKRIIAFRNRLIHGYADISPEVVWGVLESNLPRLKKEIEQILTPEQD